jgi:chromosome segregation ATPase
MNKLMETLQGTNGRLERQIVQLDEEKHGVSRQLSQKEYELTISQDKLNALSEHMQILRGENGDLTAQLAAGKFAHESEMASIKESIPGQITRIRQAEESLENERRLKLAKEIQVRALEEEVATLKALQKPPRFITAVNSFV